MLKIDGDGEWQSNVSNSISQMLPFLFCLNEMTKLMLQVFLQNTNTVGRSDDPRFYVSGLFK